MCLDVFVKLSWPSSPLLWTEQCPVMVLHVVFSYLIEPQFAVSHFLTGIQLHSASSVLPSPLTEVSYFTVLVLLITLINMPLSARCEYSPPWSNKGTTVTVVVPRAKKILCPPTWTDQLIVILPFSQSPFISLSPSLMLVWGWVWIGGPQHRPWKNVVKVLFYLLSLRAGGLRDIWSPRHAKHKIPEWAADLYKKAIPINSELLVKSKKYLFTQVSHPVECIGLGNVL